MPGPPDDPRLRLELARHYVQVLQQETQERATQRRWQLRLVLAAFILVLTGLAIVLFIAYLNSLADVTASFELSGWALVVASISLGGLLGGTYSTFASLRASDAQIQSLAELAEESLKVSGVGTEEEVTFWRENETDGRDD